MLRKLFGIDGSFTNVMGKFADIILVSGLWIVCSLPIVTIATSTAAFYYALIKGVRKDRGTPTHEFLDFFKKNWKQGVGISLIYIVFAVLVILNFKAVSHMDKSTVIYSVYRVEALWVILMFGFLSIFLFPVFSRFEYGCWDTVKTSILMAIRHTFSSLFMFIVLVFVIFISAKYPILVVFFPGMMQIIFSLRIESIFRKYMKEPAEGEIIPWYWEKSNKVVQDDE